MTDYLADSNILLRSIQEDHPLKPVAFNAVSTLLERGDQVFLVPQVLYEFWVVCTRPEGEQPHGGNGLGMTPEATVQEMARLMHLLPMIPDDERIFGLWTLLVSSYGVLGKQAHDTRLVAAMLTHNITHLLTFNGRHFDRYDKITVVDPNHILPATPTPAEHPADSPPGEEPPQSEPPESDSL